MLHTGAVLRGTELEAACSRGCDQGFDQDCVVGFVGLTRVFGSGWDGGSLWRPGHPVQGKQLVLCQLAKRLYPKGALSAAKVLSQGAQLEITQFAGNRAASTSLQLSISTSVYHALPIKP